MNPDSISFEEAMAETNDLLVQIARDQISQSQAELKVATLVSTVAGARGFLVAYLTGDFPIADTHPESIVKALKKNSKIVSDLIVKNIVMSSTMAITHGRNGALGHRAGSLQVTRRSLALTNRLGDAETMRKLAAMHAAIDAAVNKEIKTCNENADEELASYTSFLDRWNYDEEQLKSAKQALVDALERM